MRGAPTPTSNASPALINPIENHTMTRKQTIAIVLMCVAAALLAALMLWRQPGTPEHEHADHDSGEAHHSGEARETGGAHQAHEDSHGHDDRHAEPESTAAPAQVIAMSEAQVKANGIGVVAAQAATIRDTLHLPAQVLVNADRSVAIAAPARGIVQAVLVSPGSVVRKGQDLLTLQSPDVAEWRADAAVATQRLALARTVHARERKLWDERISARQDLELAEAALAEATLQAEATRQRLATLGIAGGSTLGAVTLRAPLAGMVIERPAVAGMAVDGTQSLLTIADLDQVWIEAAVPNDSLAQVTPGMPATVTAAALAEPLHGTVSFIGPVLGQATRMATARITLANPGLRLRPGMLATVDLLGQPADAAVTVAADAVQTVHERSVVFVRTAAGFEPRTVVTGRTDGRRTAIVKGLAAGTLYAAAGSYLLKADLGKSEAEHDH
jgi:cobalt-zinc-cadmium efflux system membrane fusion protein